MLYKLGVLLCVFLITTNTGCVSHIEPTTPHANLKHNLEGGVENLTEKRLMYSELFFIGDKNLTKISFEVECYPPSNIEDKRKEFFYYSTFNETGELKYDQYEIEYETPTKFDVDLKNPPYLLFARMTAPGDIFLIANVSEFKCISGEDSEYLVEIEVPYSVTVENGNTIGETYFVLNKTTVILDSGSGPRKINGNIYGNISYIDPNNRVTETRIHTPFWNNYNYGGFTPIRGKWTIRLATDLPSIGKTVWEISCKFCFISSKISELGFHLDE